MYLPPSGVEYYDLTIITTPQVSGWQASFDDGLTWLNAVLDGGDPTHFRWLLKGPLASGADPSATLIDGDTQPLLRLSANPELTVRKGPFITLTTPVA